MTPTQRLLKLVFLPAVLGHESTHYLVARLLGLDDVELELVGHPSVSWDASAGAVWKHRLVGLAPVILGWALSPFVIWTLLTADVAPAIAVYTAASWAIYTMPSAADKNPLRATQEDVHAG